MTTDPSPPVRKRGRPPKGTVLPSKGPCSFPSCGRKEHVKGLCLAHYSQRYRKPDAPLKPIGLPNAKIERMVTVAAAVKPETAAALRALAKNRGGVSVSQLLRQVLESWPALKTPEAKP